jgi:serine/threonine protein phosphatase PrpC
MRIRVIGATDVGLVRTRNEDCFGFSGSGPVQSASSSSDATTTEVPFLAVVADGLGGHPCGDIASRTVVEAILDAAPFDGPSLVAATRAADEALIAAALLRTECNDMRSTVAAVLVLIDRVIVANVGDSRIYLIEPKGPMTQLTIDDVPARTTTLPGAAFSGLTQSLGGSAEITPHLVEVYLEAPCRLLVCSDGLSSYVPGGEISDVVRDGERDESLRHLLDASMAAGGHDNVTALLIEIE